MEKGKDTGEVATGAYRNVRALVRGLDLLVELNRVGRSTPRELALITGIDRTTTYRLLHTLVEEGFVTRNVDDTYGLTLAVRRLSEGFTDVDWISSIVAPELGQLVPKILWATDFATFHQGTMIIRESTHRFSPHSVYRSMIGRPRPLLLTALGRAVVAHVDDADRADMLELVIKTQQPDMREAQDADYVARVVETTVAQGYATSVGLIDGNTSAIALPVKRFDKVVGSINMIFFRRLMSPAEAAERYLDIMKESVAKIEQALRDAAE